MGLNFNVDANKAIDQVVSIANRKMDKNTAEKATSTENIIKVFFKDTSYEFNKFYEKLIDADKEWIYSDDCAEELIGWQFITINGEIFTPIQERENPSSGELEYRINPSFYEAFKSYFDEHIRPNM